MLGIFALFILISLIVVKIQNLKNIDLDDVRNIIKLLFKADYTNITWVDFKS